MAIPYVEPPEAVMIERSLVTRLLHPFRLSLIVSSFQSKLKSLVRIALMPLEVSTGPNGVTIMTSSSRTVRPCTLSCSWKPISFRSRTSPWRDNFCSQLLRASPSTVKAKTKPPTSTTPTPRTGDSPSVNSVLNITSWASTSTAMNENTTRVTKGEEYMNIIPQLIFFCTSRRL